MNFTQMPYDVTWSIGLQSDLPELLNLCQTNKQFNEICEDEQFWWSKFIHDFRLDTYVNPIMKSTFDNKAIYILRYKFYEDYYKGIPYILMNTNEVKFTYVIYPNGQIKLLKDHHTWEILKILRDIGVTIDPDQYNDEDLYALFYGVMSFICREETKKCFRCGSDKIIAGRRLPPPVNFSNMYLRCEVCKSEREI